MQRLIHLSLLFYLLSACSFVTTVEESQPIKSIPIHFVNPNGTDQRATLIKEAQKLKGKKYKYGGTTPKGFDCSGFTSYVYQQIDITLPRSSSAQSQNGKKITAGAAQPGDLLFFKLSQKGKISHVAMVVSNDKDGLEVIHSTTSRGVIQEKIDNSTYWAEKLLYGRNYIDAL